VQKGVAVFMRAYGTSVQGITLQKMIISLQTNNTPYGWKKYSKCKAT
jgi:hypothetical protein